MIDDGDYIYEVIIYKVIMMILNEVRWHCISLFCMLCIALVKVNHGGLTKA